MRLLNWAMVMATAIASLGPAEIAAAAEISRSLDASSPARIASAPLAPGSKVTMYGEAIGEVLRAREGEAWVNLLGEGVGVGVVMSREQASSIRHFASYRERGDMVLVTGTFNQACPEHGGDLDVHAATVRVVRTGRPVTHPVRWWKLVAASAVSSVVALQAALYRRRKLRDY